jgi:hypothetical protein
VIYRPNEDGRPEHDVKLLTCPERRGLAYILQVGVQACEVNMLGLLKFSVAGLIAFASMAAFVSAFVMWERGCERCAVRGDLGEMLKGIGQAIALFFVGMGLCVAVAFLLEV